MSNLQITAPASGVQAEALLEREGALPFWALMFFTFVLFVAPQFIFPVLQSLYPAKLSAGLALVTYLVEALRSGRLSVNAPVVRSVSWLVALAILSIPFSRWPGGSVDTLTNDLVKSVIIFLLIANTVTTIRRMRLMIGSMALWGALMAWNAIRDYSTGNLAVAGIRILGYESPLTADPNDLSLTLNLILGLLIGFYLSAERPLKKVGLLVLMGVLAAGVISSFSRGGFLTIAAILIVFMAKRVRQRGISALVGSVVLLLIALPLLPGGYGDRVYSIFDTSTDTTGSADVRWEVMVMGFKLMLANPLVGLGLGMHGLAIPETGLGWQGIHSSFIQIGADLGVAAFLLYLFLVWQLYRGARQLSIKLGDPKEDQEIAALATGIEIALVAYAVGGFLLPVAYRFYLFYIGGFAVALAEIAKRKGLDAPLLAKTGSIELSGLPERQR